MVRSDPFVFFLFKTSYFISKEEFKLKVAVLIFYLCFVYTYVISVTWSCAPLADWSIPFHLEQIISNPLVLYEAFFSPNLMMAAFSFVNSVVAKEQAIVTVCMMQSSKGGTEHWVTHYSRLVGQMGSQIRWVCLMANSYRTTFTFPLYSHIEISWNLNASVTLCVDCLASSFTNTSVGNQCFKNTVWLDSLINKQLFPGVLQFSKTSELSIFLSSETARSLSNKRSY